jgi:aryl-alcohol dehydrogenase-like predicted oxidoreductase
MTTCRPAGDLSGRINAIGYGAWAAGGAEWGPHSDAAFVEAIRRAPEHGINWIDTAPSYGLGHSEEVVGAARAALKPDDRPLIFTKCSRVWDGRGRITGCLRRTSIRRECESSLRRLRVDAIDLYQIHQPDPERDIEEGWAALSELQAEGKVRWIGVSNFSVAQMTRIQPIADIDAAQPEYSLVRRGAERTILPFCAEQRIPTIVWSPLMRGLLSGRMTRSRIDGLPSDDTRRAEPEFVEPKLSQNLALVHLLDEIGSEHGYSPAQVALAWVLRHPAVTGAIVGIRGPNDIQSAADAAEVTLSPQAWATIDRFIDPAIGGVRAAASSRGAH